jgi:hypothetical protein
MTDDASLQASSKRLLAWLVAVAFFMESLDTTILNTAVPAIAAALQVAPLSMKSVLASYTLSLTVFIPIGGWMADRFGTRRVFASAIGLFTLGSLLGDCGGLRMLLRGGIFSRQRITRHLWRMCFGLFIATGSFFLGQQQVFPAFLRGTIFLTVPALLPFPLLIYWLIRVRFKKAYKGRPASTLVPWFLVPLKMGLEKEQRDFTRFGTVTTTPS